MAILSFIGEAAAGGAFGIVGTALGRVASFFERKQTFEQEQARWENQRHVENHQLELIKAQDIVAANEKEREAAIIRENGSWEGLEKSIDAQIELTKTAGGSPWVINVLRLVRPVITLLLWVITAWIFAQTQDGEIAQAAVFAATAATMWWFGDRAPKTISSAPINFHKG